MQPTVHFELRYIQATGSIVWAVLKARKASANAYIPNFVFGGPHWPPSTLQCTRSCGGGSIAALLLLLLLFSGKVALACAHSLLSLGLPKVGGRLGCWCACRRWRCGYR